MMIMASGAIAAEAPYETLWVEQLSISTEYDDIAVSVAAVSVDGKDYVYVTGYSEGSLPGADQGNQGSEDAFLTQYNGAGEWKWTRQIGTDPCDRSLNVSVDESGNAYICGWTKGELPGGGGSEGGTDAFVASYNLSGTRRWITQFGTVEADIAESLSIDPSNDYVDVSGETEGAFPNFENKGHSDVYWARFTTSSGSDDYMPKGQFGSSCYDRNEGVSTVWVDTEVIVYLSGWTTGDLPLAELLFANHMSCSLLFAGRFSPTTTCRPA